MGLELVRVLAWAQGLGPVLEREPALVRAQARVTIERGVPAACFWPRPEVESALVRLPPRAPEERPVGELRLPPELARRIFQGRRNAQATTPPGGWAADPGPQTRCSHSSSGGR